MEVTISLICLQSLILLIWFRTEAFVEYFKHSWFAKLFKINEYEEVNPDTSYIDFLREYYNCFFVRLITCPICLSVWLGGFLALFANILSYPVITVFGLFFYLLISKLL